MELSQEGKDFVLGIYKHYKGGEYETLFVSRHTEGDNEELVIYKSVDDAKVWARPLSMWNEDVEVGDQKVKRFEKIN